jgi:hypothetical protein
VSIIRATTQFPTDEPLIRLNRGQPQHHFYNQLTSITLDGSDRAHTGVYAENVQEHGGLTNCRVIKWLERGIHFRGSQAMHFALDDLWVYSSTRASSSAVGIHLERVGDTTLIQRATVVGTSVTIADCILVERCPSATVRSSHFEGATSGIQFVESGGSAEDVTGHETLETIVLVKGAMSRVHVLKAERLGAQHRVTDRTSGSTVYREAMLVLIGGEIDSGIAS